MFEMFVPNKLVQIDDIEFKINKKDYIGTRIKEKLIAKCSIYYLFHLR